MNTDKIIEVLGINPPRNWKACLAEAGLAVPSSRQELWDLMNPSAINCRFCKKICPTRQTNIGRLNTCGETVCRNKLKAEKTNATCLTRYGVSSPSKAATAKAASKVTSLSRYGVSHPSKLPSVQAKRAKTNLARYGCLTPAWAFEKAETSISLRKITMAKVFETETLPVKRQHLLTTFDVELVNWGGREPSELYHIICGTTWHATFSDGIPRCPKCGSSKEQAFVEKILRDADIPFRRNDRKTIAPYELDIHCEDLKLAIEVNGWYWHRDGTCSSSMRQKTEMCNSLGIRLIHVMDWECNEKPELVKGHILHALGITSKKLNARSCTIAEIDAVASRNFLTNNHLAGFVRARHHFGMFSGKDLVAVLSVGKPRWGKEDLEILRWASLSDTTIRGGFSKAIKHAIKTTAARSIASFCDLRWGTGKVYSAAGFTLVGISKPNYLWHKGNQRLSRYASQKHLLKTLLTTYDASLSERDNMEANGWSRVSDCGNQKWILNIPDTSILPGSQVAC